MRIISFQDDVDKGIVTFTVKLNDYEKRNFDVKTFEPIDVIRQVRGNFNHKAIQEIVYDYFELPDTLREKMKDAKEVGRFRMMNKIRQLCYFFIRTYTDMTLQKMGELYGQHHATVIHHCRTVKGLLEMEDKEYITDVDNIGRMIHAQLNLEKHDDIKTA